MSISKGQKLKTSSECLCKSDVQIDAHFYTPFCDEVLFKLIINNNYH